MVSTTNDEGGDVAADRVGDVDGDSALYGFQTIIAADVLFFTQYHTDLAAVICGMTTNDACVYVVAPRRGPTLAAFVATLRACAHTYTRVLAQREPDCDNDVDYDDIDCLDETVAEGDAVRVTVTYTDHKFSTDIAAGKTADADQPQPRQTDAHTHCVHYDVHLHDRYDERVWRSHCTAAAMNYGACDGVYDSDIHCPLLLVVHKQTTTPL